jgi:serine/threonine protein kinase
MNEAGFSDADILACLSEGERLEGRGYQGSIHTGCVGDHKILIKSAAGAGITAWLNRWMLRREYRIYRRLHGISGIPRCYGFFLDRHLVLEHVDGRTMRQTTISDRDGFFAEMFSIIESIHERGVAHGDLKRKDNILVTRDSRPCLIDFGVSIFRKPGFHPFNHFRHNFSHQHDFNAWLKHKYDRDFENMSPEDAKYFQSLWIERVSRRIKRAWHKLTRRSRL